jgi:glycosyltransferase involved in cell wall biosynthesis
MADIRLQDLPDVGSRTGWPWDTPPSAAPDAPPTDDGWPRVTVVTPSFNQGRFLEETLRSVLLQGYPNLEFIVMDGGSTDDSVAIIRRYEPWLSSWVSAPDSGQSAAINSGFAQASGALLTWLNSDDTLMPGAIFTMAASWLAHGRGAAVVGTGQTVDLAGQVIDERPARQLDLESILMWRDDWFIQPACFFPAAAFEQLGGLDEDLHYAMDLDLWIRLAKDGPGLIGVDAVIAQQKEHADQKTARLGIATAESIVVQVRHGAEAEGIRRIADIAEQLDALRDKLRPFVDNPMYRALRQVLR